MPVKLETDKTRSAGKRPSSQRSTVDLFTPNADANSSSVIPVLARNKRIGWVSMSASLHNMQLIVKPKKLQDMQHSC